MELQKNIEKKIKEEAIKGLIFDFDGTLVDLKVDWRSLKRELHDRFNTKNEEFLNDILKEIGLGRERDLLDALALVKDYECMNLSLCKSKPALEVIRNAGSLGVRVAIVSNNMSSTIRNFMLKNRLVDKVDMIVGKDDVTNYKPHEEGALVVVNKWSFPISKILYIGDSLIDYEIAKKIGVKYFDVKND